MPDITLDNSVAGADVTNTGQTINLTIAGNIVFIGVAVVSGTDQLTGITVGGVAATRLIAVNDGTIWDYIYALAAPGSGSKAIIIALGASLRHITHAASYFNVRQTGLPDASNSATTGSPLVLTVTTVADKCWGVVFGRGATIAAGTGTTSRQSEASFGSLLGDSNGSLGSPGSHSMNLNTANSGVIVSFAPIPGNFLLLF